MRPVYHRGSFFRDEQELDVVAAAAPRMGMTAAAVLSMKMIIAFRPRYIAMTGILAGVRESCNLGDIVVADPGWDYGSGKWRVENDGRSFAPAPHQIGLSSFVRGKLARMSQDQAVLDEIRRAWRGPAPQSMLRMRLGPVASGAAVLADPTITAAVKEQQHRKLLGIEMETYGFLTAAEECPLPAPRPFSLKSVCDFADAAKNDEFQDYAAFTSASALRVFVERFL